MEPKGSLPRKFQLSGTLQNADYYTYQRFEGPYYRLLQDQTFLEAFLQQNCWDKFKSSV